MCIYINRLGRGTVKFRSRWLGCMFPGVVARLGSLKSKAFQSREHPHAQGEDQSRLRDIHAT